MDRADLEREQHEAIRKHLPDHLRSVADVAYLTGWRIRELLSRQKSHLDLDAGWLRLDPGETKNHEGRMFPLTPELRAVFEAMRGWQVKTGKITQWLFHHNGQEITYDHWNHYWDKACVAAGLPDKLVHDYRRTALRALERQGSVAPRP